MKFSRREFIKLGTKGLLGGMIAYGILQLPRSFITTGEIVKAAEPEGYDFGKHYWGFVCDSEKCIGCGRCVVACKLENKVPWEPEYNRTWVERYVLTQDEEIFVDSPNGGRDGFTDEQLNSKYDGLEVWKSFFVPKLCNQCDNPPCVTVCPVGATYLTEDGVVLIDQEHCIGCRYCLQACPYGARFFLPDKGVVDKCTWCYHRITRGIVPACVEACPVGARAFGDLHDPTSAIRKILTEKRVHVLKPDLGTKPKVYYVGFEKGVL
jgi:Fe-S-cluster-containing dehydrogenase component